MSDRNHQDASPLQHRDEASLRIFIIHRVKSRISGPTGFVKLLEDVDLDIGDVGLSAIGDRRKRIPGTLGLDRKDFGKPPHVVVSGKMQADLQILFATALARPGREGEIQIAILFAKDQSAG